MEQKFSPERNRRQVDLYFEPGIHKSDAQYAKVWNAFKSGDLESHIWSSQLVDRIHAYSYNAPQLLLTTDSIDVTSHNLYYPDDVWIIGLPARPSDIIATGQTYVVGGDFYYSSLANVVFRKPSKKVIGKLNELDNSNSDLSDIGRLIEFATEDSLFVAAFAGGMALRSRKHTTNKLSRKNFLIWLSALTAARSYLLPIAAGVAPTETSKDFFEALDVISGPKFYENVWLEARTALLLEKNKEACRRLPLQDGANGVVVMGNAHDMVLGELQTITARKAVIRDYAKDALKIAMDLYAQYHNTSTKNIPKALGESVLQTMAKADIYTVTDPRGPRFQADFPRHITNYVKYHSVFYAKEVADATRGLV